MKRLLAGIIGAAAVAVTGAASAANIGTAAEFVDAMQNDPTGSHTLTADIDLTGAGYATVASFSGMLNGAGHTITGLGAQTLVVTNMGTIAALTIDGTVGDANTTYTKTDVGIFCNVSSGGKFSDCVVKGYTLKHANAGGQKQNGFFAATAYEGSSFVRCATDASCQMDQNTKANNLQGGIVGQVTAMAPNGVIAVFEDCTNNAAIKATGDYNTGWGAGGIVGKIQGCSSADIPEVDFIRCVNHGAISCTGGGGNIGGIVGHLQSAGDKTKSSRGRFVYCVNDGTVSATTGENAAGILGWSDAAATVAMEGCVNRGEVSAAAMKYAGGLVGSHAGYSATAGECVFIRNCANYAAVTGKMAGGIIARFETNTGWGTGKFRVLNSANYGTVAGDVNQAGELVSKIVVQSNANTVVDFVYCWTPTTNRYVSIVGDKNGVRVPVTTGSVSAADVGYTHEGALAALNGSGEPLYLPWVAGQGGRPELSACWTAASADGCIVTFCDWDGTILKTETVTVGGSATPPEDPVREAFEFAGWLGAYSAVTAGTTVFATYAPETFTFTFDSAGGTECEPQTYAYGDVLYLPTPTREGYEFVCWTEDMARIAMVTCPNYDPSLKALWRSPDEPSLRQLKVLQWSVKTTDARNRNQVVTNMYFAVTNNLPDIVIAVGLEPNATMENLLEATFAGYDFLAKGSNGSSDGNGRIVGYRRDRFESGTYVSQMPASNATIGYLPLHEIGTDNYYLAFDAFSADTKGASMCVNAHATVINKARSLYPTATVISCADYAAFTKDKDGEWSKTYGSDYAQALADYKAKSGLTELQAGDDLQWTLYSCAYEPHTFEKLGVTKLEDETVSTKPGYLTTFTLGRNKGIMFFIK